MEKDNFSIGEKFHDSTGPVVPHTKVLVVEDDPTTRWRFRKSLKGQCLLETAQTANVALNIYRESHPDVIFLDLNLPDGSGYFVLEKIMKENPNAYVVVCSGREDVESKKKAIAYGAKGYITKPFENTNLLQYIEACPKFH